MITENISYVLGFLTGLILVILISTVIHTKMNKGKKSYDERQQLARGRAAQYGFFVTIFYMLMAGIIKPKGIPMDTLMYIGACLGLFIFGCICIIKDAYFTISIQSTTAKILFCSLVFLASIINLILGIYGNTLGNKAHLLNLMLGIMLAALLLILLGKILYDKNKEDDHEA